MRCDAVPSKLGPSLGAANLCVTYSLLQHDAAIGSRINYCMGTSSAPHETCTRSPTLAVRQRCLVAELFPRAFEVLKGCSRYGASDWTVYASGGTPHTSSTLFQIQACRRDAPGPKTTLYCHCRPMTEVATLQPYACQHVFRSRAPSGSRHGRQCKAVCAASTKPSKYHISMCTNKTCKKQGCQQVIQFAQDLALDELEIETCGCLGICGNGPNMIVDPPGTQLSHVSSPAKFVEVLDLICNIQVPDVFLKATELRLQGNAEARGGDLPAAERAYSKGIELEMSKGKHTLHANRSGVRLTLGNAEGALEDAEAAVKLGPASFTTAYIRQVEALCALKRHQEAAETLDTIAQHDRTFSKSKDFKSLLKQVQAVA